jgi:hypothetical protein
MAVAPKGFGGKRAALTGLLCAIVAFAQSCSGPENGPPPSYTPAPERHYVPPSQASAPPAYVPPTGRHCCDASGVAHCEINPSPLGSQCHCPWQGSDLTWRSCQ